MRCKIQPVALLMLMYLKCNILSICQFQSLHPGMQDYTRLSLLNVKTLIQNKFDHAQSDTSSRWLKSIINKVYYFNIHIITP